MTQPLNTDDYTPMPMPEWTVHDVSTDSDKWLVIGQQVVGRDTISIDAARLAVIGHLREKYLPHDRAAFSDKVACLLDLPGHLVEHPTVIDDATECAYYQSPEGDSNRFGTIEGTCAVTLGCWLRSHHAEEADRD